MADSTVVTPDIYKPNTADRQQVQFKTVPTDSGSIGYQDKTGNVYNTREGGSLMWNTTDFAKNNPQGTIIGYNPSYQTDLNDTTTPRIIDGQKVSGAQGVAMQQANGANFNAETQANQATANAGPNGQNLPTLANGQQAGGLQMPNSGAGLQMPTGSGAQSVFDPTTGKQVSPAEAALNATKASGTKAPQSAGEVGTQVSTAISQATPPNPAATTTPAIQSFFDTNKTIQQNSQDLMDFLNPPSTQKILTDQLAKITTDQGVLAGLNTQLMNVNNIMKGTEDDIRKEIQSAGGMATNSQVLALSTARNKTLLQQATLIQDSIATAQNAIASDTTLFQNEKDMANTQFSQRSAVYQIEQTNYNNMVQAQRDAANTVIGAIGYKGYLDSLNAQGPTAVANAEKALGLGAGGLQSLVTSQTAQLNANAIANAGITTPFVNKNGEIQSATGYAYTSPQDFFDKTGMTIQQAQSKGQISAMQPSLDIQAKKANIAQSYAAINASNASAANSAASAAKTRLETSQLLDGSAGDKVQQKLEQEYRSVLVKEVSSRSGTVGTEDAKVAQANHLASLLNQYYDPKSGKYNVPQAQYGELVLGLAGMLSKTGTPTDSQTDNIHTATLKGDLNKAVQYVTGTPQNGSTDQVIKNLADSISRQAKTAESNREAGLKVLRGLAPTDLDPKRAASLEQNTLVPYSGITGIDQMNKTIAAPIDVGSTGTFSNGITWKLLPDSK